MAEKMAQTVKLTFQPKGLELKLEGKASCTYLVTQYKMISVASGEKGCENALAFSIVEKS